MIQIDVNKAKEIVKDKIREARSPQFQALDVAFMQALEAGDTAALKEIAEKKQALRDLTKKPELQEAQTVPELISVWDETLLGPSPFPPQLS